MRSEYDYVILGGGTAGCLIACRLLEASVGTVLVVEAGSYPAGQRLGVPALYTHAFGSRWDWQDTTVPQTHCLGRVFRWPRGKTLGGSSSINAMIYVRGAPADYDQWEKLGASDWNYHSVRPYFERLETPSPDAHRQSLAISVPPLQFRQSELFLQAAAEFGWHPFDADQPIGRIARSKTAGTYAKTILRGRRKGGWHLLRPWLGTECLHLACQCEVQRFVPDRDGTRAILLLQGREEQVRARKGLILAAGAIRSPLLLLQSGCGSKEALLDHRLPCVVDLPGVGQNLQDHLVFPIIRATHSENPWRHQPSLEDRWNYVRTRSGPLASNLAEVGGFGRLETNRLDPDADFPDYQLHLTPNHYLAAPLRDACPSAVSLGVTWLRPRSRGSVSLPPASPSTANACRIDPNYLSDPADMEGTIRAVRDAAKWFETAAFKSVADQPLLPKENRWDNESLARLIRAYSTTLFHPVGTCRMGTDPLSVVDPRLQVHGLQGVFVADASVMPAIPRGNTQAATWMIAERLSEWLVAS